MPYICTVLNVTMTVHELREIWATQPFRPLTIYMVDGNAVRVPHPDHLFFVPDSDMIFVVGRENGQRQFRFLTTDQIASVQT
jgi:hypothetical protein